MSVITPWDYVADCEALPDILTVEDFNILTAGKFSGDVRTSGEIAAASAAIRNYCGWHVYPSLTCVLEKGMQYGDGIIKRIGSDLLIQLPTRFLTGVSEILVDGVEYTDLRMNVNGLLIVYDVRGLDRKSQVNVTFTSGIPDSQAGAVNEVIASRVTHSLTSSYGVTSESAGGMSVTYNAGWANSTTAAALTDEAKEILTPYRVRGML